MDRMIVDHLREYLVAYLASHGIKPSAPKFQCFTGEHTDSTPSCHIVPGTKGCAWRCFGCNSSGDIFTAAHYLEGLPLEGADFWKQTVPKLAVQFKIDYNQAEITEVDKQRYQLLAVHKTAAQYLLMCHDRKDSVIKGYLEDRGWTVEIAKTMGIGAVDNFDEYLKYMISQGWTLEYIKDVGLHDGRIFNKNNLIFTVKDLDGRPIAFAARNTAMKNGGVKYINSPSSSIYKKSMTLYNLDECLNQTGPLWIVEGYPDVVTMLQAGIKKVCAIGGTAFTSPSELHREGDNHVDMLLNQNLTNVIMCLDSDKAGILNTRKLIEQHLPKGSKLSVKIHNLVSGSGDPDDFIKEHGVEKFLKISNITPFEWRLENIDYNEDSREIADEMVPLIVEEPNAITRWDMCSALSKKTTIPVIVLNEEVQSRTTGAAQAVNKQVMIVSRDLNKRLRTAYDPETVATLIGDAHGKVLNALDDKSVKKIDYTTRLMSVRDLSVGNTNGHRRRFSCGKYKMLESQLGAGFPTDAQFIMLTGFANVGKTSFLRNLAWELVRVNPEIHLIFMSVDDSFQKIINGFVSIHTGYNQTLVASPQLLEKYPSHKDQVWKAYESIDKIKDRLVVKDVMDGDTTLAMERHINEALIKYPDRKTMLILDNFHKLADVASGEPAVVSTASNKIKRMTTRYNIPILLNVELRKTEWKQRATLRDLKGSASLEYDADLAMVIHQNLHTDKQSLLTWVPPGKFPDGKPMKPEPYNEIEWQKNKISGFKGSNWYKFNTGISRLDEVSRTSIADLLEKENERQSKRRGNDNSGSYRGSSFRSNYGT